MRTIVHIGQHKTATTSIQSFLKDHRDELLGQGVYIPTRMSGYALASDFMLNIYSLSLDRQSPMKEKMKAELGPAYLTKIERDLKRHVAETYAIAQDMGVDTVLWSNEGLYLLNSIEEYRRLRSLFEQYSGRVDVVCCFRDPKSFKVSYKNQLEKKNISQSQDTDSYRYVEQDSWLFDYGYKKQLLDRVCDQCIYFEYDPVDNVKRFLIELGLELVQRAEYRLNSTQHFRERLRRRLGNLLVRKDRDRKN